MSERLSNEVFNPSNDFWPETHEVTNRPAPLVDFNAFDADIALNEALSAHHGEWGKSSLSALGQHTGSKAVIEWGYLANEHKPQLLTHDSCGNRVDEVVFHPSYHQLMDLSIGAGIHSSHWLEPKSGAHVVRAAKSYLVTQVEAGHGCPITMTSAAIPALRHQESLLAQWGPKIMACEYDGRNIPYFEKSGLTIGMAMTEKQGGSDVRCNTTRAIAIEGGEPGSLFELVGHKYFVSAPMCDAFLVLAQAPGGISCFLVPRYRPDGSKNPIQIQQLKNKMGNVSNASSETELRGAIGWLVGEQGRGVANIIDMVAMTRFDCMIGSSAGMRQAVVQAVYHCRHRKAFGDTLAQQPLMQNVLADLVIESEASVAMTMRMARALDLADSHEDEKHLLRLLTAVGKYWICKRAPGHAYEAMECLGGNGLMENCIMPRLLRESPVNSIWEGSGNVQCLDMMRAISKTPQTLERLFAEFDRVTGVNQHLDMAIAAVKSELNQPDNMAYRARQLVEKIALAFQGACLVQYGDEKVADAFCQGRLNHSNQGWVYGTLPVQVDCEFLLDRALDLG